MRKLALIALLWALPAFAQTTTTYTGTVKDLTGAVVTSGRITWDLNAPGTSVISGIGSFTSTSVSCLINATGNPVSSSDGTSPCVITNNTALTPSGTSYRMCIQPYNVPPGACINTFATGGTPDISVLVPTPATQPSYGAASTQTANTWTQKQTFPSVAVTGSLTAASVNGFVSVTAMGAKCDGSTNDTAAFTAAIALASSGSGVVQLPVGTCLANILINAGSQSNLTIQGKGRRSSFLQPATNAPVITIDSTVNPIQSVDIGNIGFLNNGFAQPAIYFKGSTTVLGINGYHHLHDLFFCGLVCSGHSGFFNTIQIGTDVEESTFEKLEIDGDQNNGIDINSGAQGATNGLLFDHVIVQSSAANGMHITSSGSAITTASGGNSIINSTLQNNGANGLLACNVVGLDISGSYFETNVANNMLFPNTDSGNTCQYAIGLSVHGNLVWGSAADIVLGSLWTAGAISGNFFGSTISLANYASWTNGTVQAFGNWDQNTHSLFPDASGNYHLAIDVGKPPTTISASGTMAPSVGNGINSLRFTNTAPVTVTNLTNGNPGQEVQIFNDGTSTVTLASANTNGMFMNGVTNIVLTNGQSIRAFLSANNQRWVMQFDNGPLNATSLSFGLNTILPAALTGYHGTAGVKVQLSDGTGTPGNLPKIAADGSITDGIPAPIVGVATLVSGTVTVSNAAACNPGTSCEYKLTRCAANASTGIGSLSVGTVAPGTSFIVNSLSPTAAVLTTDLSTVCWQIN